MEKLEKDIEKKLRRMVEKHGGQCLKWVCPGWSGVPDRIVLLPGERIIFVETKRPKGGVLSALQRYWREKLRSLDFSHWTIWDDKDLELFEKIELLATADETHERQSAVCPSCGRTFDILCRCSEEVREA
jgi:hypothetical protein